MAKTHTKPARGGKPGAADFSFAPATLDSADPLTNKDMAINHLLDAAILFILRSLDLRDVAPGVYELIALPLKLRGAEGSPVRAVLRLL